MALRPELVSPDRPHRDDTGDTDPRSARSTFRDEQFGAWQQIDGYTDSPSRADADRGKLHLDVIVQAVADAWVRYYNS